MSFGRSHWLRGGGEPGISIETGVEVINLTAAILVLFPVNLKQMRVILAIIQRREETANIMLIVSPHRLLNATAFKRETNIFTIIILLAFLRHSKVIGQPIHCNQLEHGSGG